MTIDEIKERLGEIKSRLKELDAEFTGEELPAESRDEWECLEGEEEEKERTLKELEFRRERVAKLAEKPEHREEGASFHTRRADRVSDDDIWNVSDVRRLADSPQAETRELQDRAKRAIEMATFPREDVKRDAAQEHVERLIEKLDGPDGKLSRHILQTGSPDYRRAFGKKLMGAHLTRDEDEALSRALGIAEGKTGNFAIPFTLDPTIIPTSNYVVNPIRQIARVEPVVGNLWKGVTAGAITAAYAIEGKEAGDNAPELGQPEVPIRRAQAFVPYSIEVGADWGALEASMAKLLADSKDVLEATEFLEGSGETEKPAGIAKGATELIETATEKAFAIADVYALEEALPPRWRTDGRFLANRAIYNKIRQFDTAGGAGLWRYIGESLDPAGVGVPNAQAPSGNAGRLLGYPAHELSTMQSTVTQAKTIAFFGDFDEFLIAERLGMTVELIPTLFGKENVRPTGQRGLYAIWRNGSKVLNKAAFRGLKVK